MLLVPIDCYFYPTSDVKSVNGSFATGVCNDTLIDNDLDSLHLSGCGCEPPYSCALFDGYIPTLTGLDGDTWASQLFTMETESQPDVFMHHMLLVGVDHSMAISRDRVIGVNVTVVLFNCPQWRISVRTIQLLGSNPTLGAPLVASNFQLIASKTVTQTSCDSLLRVYMYIPVNATSPHAPILALKFLPQYESKWIHLAEVTFYGHVHDENPTTGHTHSNVVSANDSPSGDADSSLSENIGPTPSEDSSLVTFLCHVQP